MILFWGTAPPAAEPVRTVLVLYGENRLSPGLILFDENFRSSIQAGAVQRVELMTEFLDVGWIPEERYESLLADFLRGKYLGKAIDVIVAGGPTALKFLLRHREQFLPGIPVVHSAMPLDELKSLPPMPNVVGVPINLEPIPTFQLALNLHPKARRLVLVTGTSAWDRVFERQLREAAPKLPTEIRVEFLAGLPMAELLERLRALPDDSVVYAPSFFRDGAGQSFISRDAIAQIATASPVPVFSFFNPTIGTGIVGGYMPTFEAMGWQAGDIVLRLLAGEAPSALRLPAAHKNGYIFDWRQLRRFGIDEKALPEGSIIQFREPTFWEAYRERVIAVLLVVSLQAIFIVALLAQRRSRKQACAELRESEKRMNLVAEATGVGMWLWDIARDDIWATSKARALYGLPESQPVTFKQILGTLHPADREPTQKAVDETLATGKDFKIQYRVPHSEGQFRWVSARGQVEYGELGQPASLIGVSFDITAQKLADLEAERNRNELAHLDRVGLLGQLSGAITHELNQPLTAILSYAQAAQRLLTRKPVDLQMIGEIFQDIAKEDLRAAEVIRRLRTLFKRGDLQRQPLDLSGVVRETLDLMQSDLLTRHTILVEALADNLPPVTGDRVQLQQVLLNLIINACEAMADNEPDERKLTIRTGLGEDDKVMIEVADLGKGISSDAQEHLFAPFFTTKPQGMGMGLAISRSIVEAHRGFLTASKNPGRGATFRVSLPALKDSN